MEEITRLVLELEIDEDNERKQNQASLQILNHDEQWINVGHITWISNPNLKYGGLIPLNVTFEDGYSRDAGEASLEFNNEMRRKYSENIYPEIIIYDLAIQEEYRRKGFGLHMLRNFLLNQVDSYYSVALQAGGNPKEHLSLKKLTKFYKKAGFKLVKDTNIMYKESDSLS